MNTPRIATSLSFAFAALALAACAAATPSASESPLPSGEPTSAGKVRAPDAEGTIFSASVGDGSVVVVLTADPGYEYYADAVLDIAPSAGSNGEDGITVDPTDLVAGDRIRVWTTICLESYPVQCGVDRVEIIEP